MKVFRCEIMVIVDCSWYTTVQIDENDQVTVHKVLQFPDKSCAAIATARLRSENDEKEVIRNNTAAYSYSNTMCLASYHWIDGAQQTVRKRTLDLISVHIIFPTFRLASLHND